MSTFMTPLPGQMSDTQSAIVAKQMLYNHMSGGQPPQYVPMQVFTPPRKGIPQYQPMQVFTPYRPPVPNLSVYK